MQHDLRTLTTSFLSLLHEREVRQDDADSVQRFGQAYQQLLQCARQASRETQNRIIESLSAGMSQELSNWEFGCLANTCGTIVEYGGDPKLTIEPILDRITQQFSRVAEFVQI